MHAKNVARLVAPSICFTLKVDYSIENDFRLKNWPILRILFKFSSKRGWGGGTFLAQDSR